MIDVVSCAICGHTSRAISTHVFRTHKIKAAEYRRIYKCETASETYKDEIRQRLIKNGNPFQGHNGKYSPFSIKFILGDVKQDTIDKAQKTRKSNPHKQKTRIEYWINQGYDIDDAKKKLSEYQRKFSLDICIKKYGEIEGTKIWNDRQTKWQATLNSKSDEEKEIINIKRAKGAQKSRVSKQETILFEILKLSFPNIIQQHRILYDGGKSFYYDMMYNKKIIEFNGSFWHAKPETIHENKDLKKDRRRGSIEEIRLKDSKKHNIAISNGYSILVVWDDDFINDKQKVVEECKIFLM